MTRVSITAVIHTLNEERYIGTAIRSAFLLADDVVVADMQSTDRTVEIARSAGARILELPRMGYADPARAQAIATITADWVLILDADELLTPALADHLRDVADSGEADAVRMSRITHMVGARVRGAGWSLGRERHIRFHRPSALEYSPILHSVARLAEGARVLELPADDEHSFVHFNYLGWDQFVEKMNRYTSTHARESFEAGGSIGRGSMLRSLLRELWDRYVRDRGYRDGYRGLVLALLMATYQLLIFAKLRQLHEVGDTDDIGRAYRAEADRLLGPPDSGTAGLKG
jgi:glycosyltransferase involved in cell wall biosynthesis